MKPLLEFWNHPLTHRAGWVLLHSLWQGAFVAVLFGLLRFALRRASARARYLAACSSLLLLVAAPAMTFLWTGTHAPITRQNVVEGDAYATGPAVATDRSAFTVGTHASLFVLQSAEFLERIAPWLVAAWFAGVLIGAARWLQGLQRVKSLRTKGTTPADPDWIERLEDLKRRLNVSRPVRLLKSACVEVPTVIGWLRPVILLPACSLTGLTPAQLEAILAHELAHVRRHDYLVNTFQNLVETLMFYHPAVWWISRRIREEREHCCDDLAVTVCGNRVVYARALATMEELRAATPQFAFAANGGSLLHRVRRLLGLPVEGETFTGRQAGGLIVMGVGLVLAIAGVGLMLAPARYEAVTQVRIEGNAWRQDDSSDSQNKSSAGLDTSSFQTAVVMIRSPLILNQVIDTLGLRDSWGKRYRRQRLSAEETLKLLQQRTGVQAVPGTHLVDIHASSDDPADAAAIANEIVRAYREQETSLGRESMRNSINALRERLDAESKKVHEVQNTLDRLRVELQIVDPDPASLAPTPTFSVETVRLLQNQQTTLESEAVRQETRLRQLQKLARSEMREAIQTSLDTPDATLTTLVNELDIAEQTLRHLEKDFSDQHPNYINARKVVADLDQRVDKRLAGILLGLQNQLDSTRARLEGITRRLEEARVRDLEMAEKSRPYFMAKRQLTELLQFKTILAMKIASQETDLSLPRTSPLVIVDPAALPSEPVSPNRSRAAALIAIGAFLGIGGLVLSKGRSAPPGAAVVLAT